MKLRVITILFSILFCFTPSQAQSREVVPKNQIEELSKELSSKVDDINTIRCSYRYKKQISMLEESIESSGEFFYDIQRDSIVVANSNGISIITAGTNPAFSEISRQIHNGKNSGSFVDESNFKVEYYLEGDALSIEMIPKKSRMKRLLSSISLSIDMISKVVKTIEILDYNQDITIVELSRIDIQ